MMTNDNDLNLNEKLWNASRSIVESDIIVIAAGAGMSSESGIDDYYHGIDKAHPLLSQMGLSLFDISNHSLFEVNPSLAWGHWITRQRNYLSIEPHYGYHIVYHWKKSLRKQIRILTTNLDRQFARIGFEKNEIFEMHGSMYDVQCLEECGVQPWPIAIEEMGDVDDKTMLALGELPRCIQCQGRTRVCTSLAVDGHWYAPHVQLVQQFHRQFFEQLSNEKKLTILEIGCGTVMNKVREEARRLIDEHRCRGGHATFIRINLYEAQLESRHQQNISLPLSALQALTLINDQIQTRTFPMSTSNSVN